MTTLDLDHLTSACRPGGAATLASVTQLTPAEGPHGGVAPARYVVPVRGTTTEGTYCYEQRYIDGKAAYCVVVDGKSSQLNRCEDEIVKAAADGVAPLSLTPRIVLRYADGTIASDMELPHRLFDGHIRAGHVDGKSVTEHPLYRAARDANPANARAILEFAPAALVLGGWDSTRKAHQGRYRSALVGEIIGELADQSAASVNDIRPPRRGAARVDAIAPGVKLTGKRLEQLLVDQESELSPKLVATIRNESKKDGRTSASRLGLGSIPPNLSSLGLVSCRRIIRSHVLSFAALRQLRFDAGPDGDAACRALLAAFALAGLARANAELNLRANCNLREASKPVTELDARYGDVVTIEPINIATADSLLTQAIEQARTLAGIRWEGQVFEVTGNEIVVDNPDAAVEE